VTRRRGGRAGTSLNAGTWTKTFEERSRRLKALEDENRRLKAAVADLTLDNRMLKDVLSKKW
jgi:hypothetical protein